MGRDNSQAALEELAEAFMPLKLVPRIFDMLVFRIRNAVERIRDNERAVMQLCVRKSKMPRKIFLKAFPGNETNLGWIDELAAGSGGYVEALQKLS